MQPEPFRLERYFAAHEFKAPYLLCCSDCESFSIDELLLPQKGKAQDVVAIGQSCWVRARRFE